MTKVLWPGNEQWGGTEYSQVTGQTYETQAHWSFADMDPVTGRALRRATRRQLGVRLERGVMLEGLVTSTCVSPTKTYAGGTGYGCTL